MNAKVLPLTEDQERFINSLIVAPPELPWEQFKKVADTEECGAKSST